MRITEPMKATSETIDPDNGKQMAIVQAHLPLFASWKLDGIRSKEQESAMLSRTMKPLPNRHLQKHFTALRAASNMDGEFILGDPTDPLCYNKTSSAVMSRDGEPDLTFYVFDHPHPTWTFADRLDYMHGRLLGPKCPPSIIMLDQHLCETWEEVLKFEKRAVKLGHEGIILRRPDGKYKQGRATLREGYAMKFKRMAHSEAIIIGMVELQHNLNEQVIQRDGSLKRSSHKENKVGGSTLGAIQVRDIHTGIEFEIGTFKGFDAEWKQATWDNRKAIIKAKTIVAYKYFPIGVKDKPRHPVLKGIRYKTDM